MFIYQSAAEPIEPEIVKALSEVCTSTLGHLRDYGFAKGLQPLAARPGSWARRSPCGSRTWTRPRSTSPSTTCARATCSSSSTAGTGPAPASAAWSPTPPRPEGQWAACLTARSTITMRSSRPGSRCTRGALPRTRRQLGIEGAINVPVTVGGTIVRPGDVVWADSDGVAILAPDEALGIAATLREKEEAEVPLRKAIDEGARLSDWSGAAAAFHAGSANLAG